MQDASRGERRERRGRSGQEGWRIETKKRRSNSNEEMVIEGGEVKRSSHDGLMVGKFFQRRFYSREFKNKEGIGYRFSNSRI